MSEPQYSLVVPFYNEEGAVSTVLAEARIALDNLGSTYEVIAVDDSSRDKTGLLLDEIAAGWKALRVIHHNCNLGQSGALWTAFKTASGRWIITMDGDGQNVPADIASLIKLTENGVDMAVGIRTPRNDSWLRRIMSRIANAVRSRVLCDGITDSGCALKVFRREIIPELLPIKMLSAFVPALAVAAGFRVAEIPVQHRERRTGIANFGFHNMAWRPALDMLGIWWWRKRRLPLVR